MRPAVCLILLVALAGCRQKPATLEDLRMLVVTLPDGTKIRAEVVTEPADMARGMMFRDSLEPGRGMLFVHPAPGQYRYWMYQVRIPLDIIWLDSQRRIVEISPDTPPCQKPSAACPSYGGHAASRYVLELAGGWAARYGLRLGDRLDF